MLLHSMSLTEFLGITGTGAVAIPTFSVQNPLAAFPPPPSNIAGALLTGIPKSVFADLANPSARASLASDFQAGNEPAWYTSLPVEVRSYLSQIHAKAPGYTAAEGTQSGPKVTLQSQKLQGTKTSAGTAAAATESKKSSSCVLRVLWSTLVGVWFFSIMLSF
jgi:hypothetical protein